MTTRYIKQIYTTNLGLQHIDYYKLCDGCLYHRYDNMWLFAAKNKKDIYRYKGFTYSDMTEAEVMLELL